MRPQRNVLTAALICATAAAVLTGCGGTEDDGGNSGKTSAKADPLSDRPGTPAPPPTTTAPPKGALEGLTAQQISDQAVAAMKGLSSVTVDFSGTDSGKKIRMKAAMTNAHKCVSHIVMSDGDLQLIAVGADTYAKGDTAFWNAQAGSDAPALNALLKGRWMKMPSGSVQDDDFKSFCDLNTFMKDFTEDDGGVKTEGPLTVIDGRTTVPISQRQDGGVMTVYVATQGEPYVLKAVETGPDAGSGTFTDFNQPVNAVAPPASQTVDVSAFST